MLMRGERDAALEAIVRGQAFYASLGSEEIVQGGLSILEAARAVSDPSRSEEDVRAALVQLQEVRVNGIHVFASFRRILVSLAAERGITLS